MKHFFEEPCISGKEGSGAIFFSGCNLRCVYCQNKSISHGFSGKRYSPKELADEMIKLQDGGVHNINLVTAAHIKGEVAKALTIARRQLKIPVVYNSSGYEGDLGVLNGLIDVYLPDFKYFDGALSAKYSFAPDYPEVAKRAIKQMYEQVGEPVIENGLIKSGVIIRHLVLPGHKDDSINIIKYIADNFPRCRVSIMSQYTPEFFEGVGELKRRITTYEYNCVINAAVDLGLEGYMQDRCSATKAFTPNFQNGSDET